MVAAYHFLGTPTPHFWGRAALRDFAPLLHEIRRYGWLGVEFFFVISGFVICMSCWGRTPAQFTVSRIARLFPAYWYAVLRLPPSVFCVLGLSLLIHATVERRLGRLLRHRLTLDMRLQDPAARPAPAHTR